MSKDTISAEAGGEPARPIVEREPNDGRKTYTIKAGVAWVNGAPTKGAETIRLTDAQARFDLHQGRIAPASSRRSNKKAG